MYNDYYETKEETKPLVVTLFGKKRILKPTTTTGQSWHSLIYQYYHDSLRINIRCSKYDAYSALICKYETSATEFSSISRGATVQVEVWQQSTPEAAISLAVQELYKQLDALTESFSGETIITTTQETKYNMKDGVLTVEKD